MDSTTNTERPARRTMANYENPFEDEDRSNTKMCNLGMPMWLRNRIKKNAKADGRSMISYLDRVIPE